MRNFFYALVLVSILAFGFFISSKTLAGGDSVASNAAYPYEIIVIKPGGASSTFTGGSQSYDPKTIIGDLGITLYPEDKVSAFPDPKLGIGSQIKILRAPVITIKDGKKETVYRSWAATVSELLAEKNIELGVDDKINASKDARIFDGSRIIIIRVAITTVIEPKPIDFQTVTKKNTSQEKDYKKILQTGAKGVKNYYYLVTREDGEEVSRQLQKTKIATPPTDRIVEIGTMVKVYGSGTATWYNRNKKLVAASNTLPAGTRVNVVNLANGKSVVVTIDDHGIQGGTIIDLSSDAFAAIGSLGAGTINVRLEKYYPE